MFWSQQTSITPTPPTCPFLPKKSHQAPKADPVNEEEFRQLKKRLLSSFKNHKASSLNHSTEQKTELKDLKSNDNIIIKPSDKCKGLVILGKSDYLDKANTITATYEEVARNPTTKTEAATKRIIRTTLNGKVSDNIIQALMPQSSRTAELYELPKDHKPGVPLRPIVSACGDPLDKMSQLIEKILSQLLQFVPAHLNNTDEYLRRLSDKYPNHILPAGTILFSVDVTNLYGNIPYQEAIDSAKQLLDTHHQSINIFGLNISDVTSLLGHCLSNNHLRFGDKFYRQTSGIAMGSRVAPPLAIIFMNSLERQCNTTAVNTPDLYMRYIDDVLGVWTSGPENLRDYLHHINSTHPSISFTIETTEDSGSIPFLDTKITRRDSRTRREIHYRALHQANVIRHHTARRLSAALEDQASCAVLSNTSSHQTLQ